MNQEALYHRHKQNWAFMYDDAQVRVRLRTARGDIDEAVVCYGDKYDWHGTECRTPMTIRLSDSLYDYWEADLAIGTRRLSYRFLLESGRERIYFGERWLGEQPPEESFGNFEYPYMNPDDAIRPPRWVKDAVFYQIFPDRFARSGESSAGGPFELWGAPPTKQNAFGGDLRGVMDKLDYLTALGIDAIYFAPLFQASSSHKYDTENYYAVDPQFGTVETLKALVEACHARGIRVLLDFVFNHTGSRFPPFLDVLERGPASRYAGWFRVLRWADPDTGTSIVYETFGYEADLPKLNVSHPETADYLLQVASYWLREADIDGFRLDVANEIDHRFWRRLRETVKAVKPDAYLLGEIFHDAMAWLGGDQLDAVMDYPVRDLAIKFFASRTIDAETFANIVSQQLAMYPQQVCEASFQLLGSHDTARLLTLCGGEEARMRQAALFQFTYIGAPCIYYGDEIGMNGENDPDNRRCMVWEPEAQNRKLFAFYRDLIAMRRTHAALRGGGIRFLHAPAGGRTLAYERFVEDGDERIVVAFNAGGLPQTISLQTGRAELSKEAGLEAWEELRTGDVRLPRDGELELSLGPYGYAVLKRRVRKEAPV